MNYNSYVKSLLLSKAKYNMAELKGFLSTKKGERVDFVYKPLGRYLYYLLKKMGRKSRIERVKDRYRVYIYGEIDISVSRRDRIDFLRGLFLSSGYLSNPAKRYSLDITVDEIDIAEYIMTMLDGYRCSLSEYSGRYRILFRRAEDIKSFLLSIGALETFLNYEETMIIKSIKEESVRRVNLEIANGVRQEHASNNHLDIINRALNSGIKLTDKMREVIHFKIKFPDLSMLELSNKIGISRSALRGRMATITKLLEKEKL